jgi:enoyl-[acyl-carrier-protein] reductase (NADH)
LLLSRKLDALESQLAGEYLLVKADVAGIADSKSLIRKTVDRFGKIGSPFLNTEFLNVKGMPGVSVYDSSKAALRSVVRSLANELTPQNIRVNAVSPGPIETTIWSKTNLTQDQVSGFAEGVSGQVPLGRCSRAEEITNTVLFLASDDVSFITGSEIPVDGGTTQV